MSNSIPPEDMGRLFAELKEIKDTSIRLETQMIEGFREANARIDQNRDVAKKAFDQSVSALRLSSDTQTKQTETERAMMSYAQTTTAAATKIVVANDAQTPLIEQTAVAMQQLKRHGPAIVGGAVVAGSVLRELVAPILGLFHR